MNRKRLLIALLVVVTIVGLLFTSCGAKEEEHVCESICVECQKCTSDCADEACKIKCEGHKAVIDMTEGVYNMLMGNYDLLIKFYDSENYYFQNENSGFRGKYEIKDEEIEFLRTQEDGTEYNSVDHPSEAGWVKGNKVIYFYQEDGVTPVDYVMNKSEKDTHIADVTQKGICYAYGSKPHVLAYNEELDQIQSFAGNNGSRTLSHTKLRNFSTNDEKAIIQEKFMPLEIPESAGADQTLSDYFLILSQKGYETNIPELSNIGIDAGRFVKSDGSTYALTDTISESKATLITTSDGAVVTQKDKTVELKTWEETKVVTEVGELLSVTVTKNLGINVNFTLTFNTDNTAVLSASLMGNELKMGTDWELNAPYVEFSNTSNGEFTYSIDGEGAHVTWSGDLSSNMKGQSITFDFPTSDLAKLQNTIAKASSLLDVTSSINVGIAIDFNLSFMSDCTAVMSANVMGTEMKITTDWVLNAPHIKFSNTSNGEFTYSIDGEGAHVTWTGDLSERMPNQSITFHFSTADLAKLMNAKPVISTKLEVATSINVGIAIEFTLKFNSNQKAIMSASVMGNNIEITADWTLGGPYITFGNSSMGEFTYSIDGEGAHVTWTGDLSANMKGVSFTFTFPSSDLAKLQ